MPSLKKTIFPYAFLLGAVLSASPAAFAQLWQAAPTLPSKQMAVGLYGQVYFPASLTRPTGVMAYGQFAYGITDQFQLETRLGIGMADLYVGFFAKFALLESGIFHLSTLAGIHRQISIYLDWNIIASLDFKDWHFYLAPVLNAALAVPLGIAVIPGVSWSPLQSFEFFTEGHVNITGLTHAVSVGLKYHLAPS